MKVIPDETKFNFIAGFLKIIFIVEFLLTEYLLNMTVIQYKN